MLTYSKTEKEILNIQIGCVLRLARLENGLSQFQLGLELGTNETMIGRIERAINFSSWDKIFILSEYLAIEFSSLFKLKSKKELLKIVENSFDLEEKLTEQKKVYYKELMNTITEKYSLLESN